ncbi:MAG: hypothetical protein V4549_18085 [Bacteroidota bacterium]
MKHELILVATEKGSHLSIHKGKLMRGKIEYINTKTWDNQTIIAISDEPIKVGDLRYCVPSNNIGTCLNEEIEHCYPDKFKKIICSTDKSLTPNSWIDISKSLWIIDSYNKDKKLPKVEFEQIGNIIIDGSIVKTVFYDSIKTNPDGSANIVEPKEERVLKSEKYLLDAANKQIESQRNAENLAETIKSVTNCPACGQECNLVGNGTTHAYVPKDKMYKKEEVESICNKLIKEASYSICCDKQGNHIIDLNVNIFIKENLK